VADFGLAGFTPKPEGLSEMDHYRSIIERLPPEFSTIWVDDHLQKGDRRLMEGWTRLTYLAAAFPRFRVGHLVLSQSFRNPALVAKMGATLQELSGGRFILGLGAGWLEEEYLAYGYDYPSGGVRVAQLEEAIEVIRAMWTDYPADYHGNYYRLEGARCEPRPEIPIPIMVGTNGPKALGVTARQADWWNWDGPWEEVYRGPCEILRRHCEEIGRPFEEITLTAGLTVWMPDDIAEFVPTYEHSFYPGQVFPVLGPTAEDVIREVELLVDHNVQHFQVACEDERTLDRFIAEVVPNVRLQPATSTCRG
jgi:alkanesulfonate monooxygenase SsuD/methylene tetrahydromethanopterin reductase-like flavin-dependent oxidoreductase (luciferase family)